MTDDASKPLGANCPGCGQRARMRFGRQHFCGNVGCDVLSWDSTTDRKTFFSTAERVTLPDELSTKAAAVQQEIDDAAKRAQS